MPVVVLAGDAEGEHPFDYRTLVDTVGEERAWGDPLGAAARCSAGCSPSP